MPAITRCACLAHDPAGRSGDLEPATDRSSAPGESAGKQQPKTCRIGRGCRTTAADLAGAIKERAASAASRSEQYGVSILHRRKRIAVRSRGRGSLPAAWAPSRGREANAGPDRDLERHAYNWDISRCQRCPRLRPRLTPIAQLFTSDTARPLRRRFQVRLHRLHR